MRMLIFLGCAEEAAEAAEAEETEMSSVKGRRPIPGGSPGCLTATADPGGAGVISETRYLELGIYNIYSIWLDKIKQ